MQLRFRITFTIHTLQAGIKCDVCKLIVEELDKVIEQNTTVGKLNETVYGICNKLEGAFQDLVSCQCFASVVPPYCAGINNSI